MHKLYHRIKIRVTPKFHSYKTPWLVELDKATPGTLVMPVKVIRSIKKTKKDNYPVLKALQTIYNIAYIAYSNKSCTDITFYIEFTDMNLEGLKSLAAELDSNEVEFIGICSDIVVKGDIINE